MLYKTVKKDSYYQLRLECFHLRTKYNINIVDAASKKNSFFPEDNELKISPIFLFDASDIEVSGESVSDIPPNLLFCWRNFIKTSTL